MADEDSKVGAATRGDDTTPAAPPTPALPAPVIDADATSVVDALGSAGEFEVKREKSRIPAGAWLQAVAPDDEVTTTADAGLSGEADDR